MKLTRPAFSEVTHQCFRQRQGLPWGCQTIESTRKTQEPWVIAVGDPIPIKAAEMPLSANLAHVPHTNSVQPCYVGGILIYRQSVAFHTGLRLSPDLVLLLPRSACPMNRDFTWCALGQRCRNSEATLRVFADSIESKLHGSQCCSLFREH